MLQTNGEKGSQSTLGFDSKECIQMCSSGAHCLLNFYCCMLPLQCLSDYLTDSSS